MILALCAGFLLAVLWMDLMFDVQVRGAPAAPAALPEPILASIAGYYRRATTEAWPMNRLIGLVMAIMVLAAVTQLIRGEPPRWAAWFSALFSTGAATLAAIRVVPNAVRLGARVDPPAEQSALARAICRDHFVCLAAIAALIAVQLIR